MMIQFTPSQSNKTRYPTSCPVWIFHNEPLYDDLPSSTGNSHNNIHNASFQRGVVQSVSINFTTKELYYRVLLLDGSRDDERVDNVTEDRLGYGAGCPVYCRGKNGRVLLCRKMKEGGEGGSMEYAVELEGRLDDCVPCRDVSFRMVGGAAGVSAGDGFGEVEGECAEKNVHSVEKKSNPSFVELKKSNVEEMAMEFNRDDGNLASFESKHDDSEQKRQIAEKRCKEQQQQQQQQRPAAPNPLPSNDLTITIPMWVQMYNSKSVQRALFLNLLGPNGSYIQQYQQQSNCKIRVNWDDDNSRHKHPSTASPTPIQPITIDIQPYDKRPTVAQYDVASARRMIEDNLFKFSPSSRTGPVINNDGSMGRLLYEIAKCHQQSLEGCTSNAVWQTNPFDEECKECYMSLFEIPMCTAASGHNATVFRLEEKVWTRVSEQTRCSFSLVGNEYGIRTLYCDSYVLVLGHDWRDVDGAVDILKEEIKRFVREDAAAVAAMQVESVKVLEPEIKLSDLTCSIASDGESGVNSAVSGTVEKNRSDESKPASALYQNEYQGQSFDAKCDLKNDSVAQLPVGGAKTSDTAIGRGVESGEPFVTPQYTTDASIVDLQRVDVCRETRCAEIKQSAGEDANAISTEPKSPRLKWTPPKQEKAEQPQLSEKSDCLKETESNKRHITPLRDEDAPTSKKRLKSSQRMNGEYNGNALSESRSTTSGHHLCIPIPQWVQKHRSHFLHQFLIGENSSNIQRIRRETNCRMEILWDEYANKHGLPQRHPMRIQLNPIDSLSNSSPRDLQQARVIIQDIFLKFRPSVGATISNFSIGDDGSRGRLAYDVAAAAAGPHRPKESKSCAVKQLNPFEGNLCFMSVLDLPRTVNKVNTIFHGHFLTEQQVITKVKSLTGCSFKLVGDDFGIKTRFCEPYVLVVSGPHQHWNNVDQAVEILQREIATHQRKCACFY